MLLLFMECEFVVPCTSKVLLQVSCFIVIFISSVIQFFYSCVSQDFFFCCKFRGCLQCYLCRLNDCPKRV